MDEDERGTEPEDLLDLSEVMRAFGVDTWTNLGPPQQASTSELFQVRVEIGNQHYLLRERPAGLVESENTHVYAFQRYLAEHGIPIAPLRLTPQGRPYVTLGEEMFELQEERAGQMFDSRDARERDWIAAAGRLLGRMHLAACEYPGPRYRWPSEVQAGGLTQGWLNFARGQAEQCEVYALTAALSNLVDAWEAALPAAMMAIGTGRDLPELPIHGDYTAQHLRFSGRDVSQVVGWEASRWEKRLLEVAYGVFGFAGLSWQGESGLTRPLVRRGLDPARAALFLGNYSAVYPAVLGESALLVDALTLIAPILIVNGPLEGLLYSPLQGETELPIEDALERLAWASALPTWLTKVRRSFTEMW